MTYIRCWYIFNTTIYMSRAPKCEYSLFVSRTHIKTLIVIEIDVYENTIIKLRLYAERDNTHARLYTTNSWYFHKILMDTHDRIELYTFSGFKSMRSRIHVGIRLCSRTFTLITLVIGFVGFCRINCEINGPEQ